MTTSTNPNANPNATHGPRVALVEPGTRPELAEMEARIQGARGRISPLYQVLLNSPAVVEGWEAMLTAIRNKTGISARHPHPGGNGGPGGRSGSRSRSR